MPAARIASISPAVQPNSVSTPTVCSPRAGTAPILGSVPLTTGGGSAARTGPAGVPISPAIVYLASDAASYTTGSLMWVNGGRPS